MRTPTLWRDKLGFDRIDQVKTSLVTVGSPRVGNRAWSAYAQALFREHQVETYRIVQQKDVVPHFPTKLMGYRHIAREIWVQNATATPIMCDANNGEDPACSNSARWTSYTKKDHFFAFDILMKKGNHCE